MQIGDVQEVVSIEEFTGAGGEGVLDKIGRIGRNGGRCVRGRMGEVGLNRVPTELEVESFATGSRVASSRPCPCVRG